MNVCYYCLPTVLASMMALLLNVCVRVVHLLHDCVMRISHTDKDGMKFIRVHSVNA